MKKPATKKKPAAARKLSDRERLFVAEYLKDLNATQAAIRAGYAKPSARQQGYRLLTKDHVSAAIAAGVEKREEQIRDDSEWLRERLRAEADADIADLYDDNGDLLPIKEWPAVWRRGLVVSIETMTLAADEDDVDVELEPQGHGGALKRAKKPTHMVLKIKYADRVRRLELLGRHHKVGAWKDKVQHDLTDPLKKLAEQIIGKSIRPADDGSGNQLVRR